MNGKMSAAEHAERLRRIEAQCQAAAEEGLNWQREDTARQLLAACHGDVALASGFIALAASPATGDVG